MLSLEKLTISIYTRSLLLEDDEIRSLVGEKIFPSVAPENTLSPFIIYERDAYATEDTKFGISKEEARVTFEISSDDYDKGLQIAVAMRRTLQGNHDGLYFEIVDSAERYKEGKFIQLIEFKIT